MICVWHGPILLPSIPTMPRPATSDPHQLGIQLSEIGAAIAVGTELLREQQEKRPEEYEDEEDVTGGRKILHPQHGEL